MAEPLPGSRASLSLIALISGLMGFTTSTLAVPAGSTALAADALVFLRDSAVAWLAMWVSMGAFRRPRLVVRVIGVVMVLLGTGVVVIAFGRLNIANSPSPLAIMMLGGLALVVSFIFTAMALRQHHIGRSIGTLWRARGTAVAGHIAVIGAGVAVYLTGSNLPDVLVGGVIAALFLSGGLEALWTGRLEASTGRI